VVAFWRSVLNLRHVHGLKYDASCRGYRLCTTQVDKREHPVSWILVFLLRSAVLEVENLQSRPLVVREKKPLDLLAENKDQKIIQLAEYLSVRTAIGGGKRSFSSLIESAFRPMIAYLLTGLT